MNKTVLEREPLGESIPPRCGDAVSFSVPSWDDVVKLESGDMNIKNKLRNGYPRFGPPNASTAVCSLMKEKYGKKGEDCLLFPSHDVAARCLKYISAQTGRPAGARVQTLPLNPEVFKGTLYHRYNTLPAVVFISEEDFVIAKQFWTLDGEITSSRFGRFLLVSIVNPG